MPAIPQLQVLRAIVIADPVLMMNRLVRLEQAPELAFHDQPMLEHAVLPRGRMIRRPCEQVAVSRVDERLRFPATLPQRVAVSEPAGVVHLTVAVALHKSIASLDRAFTSLAVAFICSPLPNRGWAWVAVLPPSTVVGWAPAVATIPPRSGAALDCTPCCVHTVSLS
jgi:hypothetical protein